MIFYATTNKICPREFMLCLTSRPPFLLWPLPALKSFTNLFSLLSRFFFTFISMDLSLCPKSSIFLHIKKFCSSPVFMSLGYLLDSSDGTISSSDKMRIIRLGNIGKKKKLFANFSPLTLFVAHGCRCCATMMLTPFLKIIKILCCLTSKDHFACQRCWSYGKIALLIKKLFDFARDVGKGSKSFSRHYNFVIIFQVTKGKFLQRKMFVHKADSHSRLRKFRSSQGLLLWSLQGSNAPWISHLISHVTKRENIAISHHIDLCREHMKILGSLQHNTE